ncbi:pilus assembly protein PilP [Desulfobulbus sp. F4]|nr:pilus assembly protein PilP [Desulfobulbus sp. F3]MCW5200509.1 pilus assembly protein PilP [Desulfobulbus sp. F4]
MTQKTSKIQSGIFIAAVLLAGKMFWAALPATAQTVSETAPAVGVAGGGNNAEKKLDAVEERKRSKFNYQLDNRPDPFYSFIAKQDKEKAKSGDDPIVDDNTGKPLTGMQLFEPGQLRLVAVMGIQGDKIAMAEDMAGKGYVLREKMLIGKYGQIVRIEDNGQIIIKEIRKTLAGRELTNDIVMSLKKDEDNR